MEHMNFLQEREISAVERDSDDDVRGEDDEYLRGVSGGADGFGEVAPAVSYSGMRSHHNTGPKGVLADYREHQAKMVIKDEWERERLEARAKQNSFAPMTSAERKLASQESFDGSVMETLKEEEEKMLAEYREKRLQEMRNAQKPRFGSVRTITLDTFLPAVEGENPSVTVVINLENASNAASCHTTFCLREVARRYVYTKFCVANVHEIKPDWNMELMPTILVYRGGKLFESLIAIGRDLGETFFAQELGDFLAEHGVIAPTTGDWRAEASVRSRSSWDSDRSDEEEEEEEDDSFRRRRVEFVY